MNTLGNLLWILLGGWLICLLYILGSLVLFVTIVGIPFGLQTMKLAALSLFPFGREVVPGQRMSGCLYLLMNILWLLVVGLALTIAHLVLALLTGITIIGLPFALQHLKLARLALIPFGHDIVHR
jgi:uncharacterized membrane protein YccF (DUF307 family)